MLSRTKLLQDLAEQSAMEDDFVAKLSGFLRSSDWPANFSVELQERIQQGINILCEDSKRHTLIVREMLEHLERSSQNEF